MEMITSYNKTELSRLERTPYSRIDKDRDLYFPIRIESAQSRATAKWYTVRYVRKEDVMKYIDENPMKLTQGRTNDKKFKKDLKK